MTTIRQFLQQHNFTPIIGRPVVGDKQLPAIITTTEMRDALILLANRLGKTVACIRREAYQNFIEDNQEDDMTNISH